MISHASSKNILIKHMQTQGNKVYEALRKAKYYINVKHYVIIL